MSSSKTNEITNIAMTKNYEFLKNFIYQTLFFERNLLGFQDINDAVLARQ